MIIKHNKNLTYTKIPGGIIELRGEAEMDIKKMFLISVNREGRQALEMDLKIGKNKKIARIRSKNISGEKDLDFLEKELKEKFISRTYDEILSMNFQND